MWINILYNL